jgi:integrase/recombinase XerC
MDPRLRAHLVHLEVERRLAARTLAIYADAFAKLQACASRSGVALIDARSHHIRRWAAQLHGSGLAPRSIALILSAWRGFYRWLGRDGLVAINPVLGVRAPKAARPLPKALSVDQAVALAEHRADATTSVTPSGSGKDSALAARDHCIVEFLYGCGLRVAELIGLDRCRRRQRVRPRQGLEAAQRAGRRPGAEGARRLAGVAPSLGARR